MNLIWYTDCEKFYIKKILIRIIFSLIFLLDVYVEAIRPEVEVFALVNAIVVPSTTVLVKFQRAFIIRGAESCIRP